MKKWIILSVVIIITLISAGLLYFAFHQQSPHDPKAAQKAHASAPKFKRACDIASATQVSSAFNASFSTSVAQMPHSGPAGAIISSCKFTEANGGSNEELLSALNVKVQLDTYPSESSARTALEHIKETSVSGTTVSFIKTDVMHIADEAFFFQSQAPASLKTEDYMYVRKDSQIIHLNAIKINGIDHDKTQAALEELAKKTLN